MIEWKVEKVPGFSRSYVGYSTNALSERLEATLNELEEEGWNIAQIEQYRDDLLYYIIAWRRKGEEK
jgi:hypothetical protein